MASKILIVDDDPKWLRVLELYLRKHEYRVTTAASGEEAIRMVAEDRPDLVIADIAMPGMDGYELCSRFRRDAHTRAIPFIFLTAKDQDSHKIKARKLGADDYLTKPCPLEVLAQAVETAIDRIEQARRIPLERIGVSGRLEDVDLLDMIQTLELDQRTGALVLSHGERTATIYFREGMIVDADIRSPKREEPLFVLLGWKTGRYLFLPDAEPARMRISASVANLLVQDLRALEQHEREHRGGQPQATGDPPAARTEGSPHSKEPAAGLVSDVLARLEAVAHEARAALPPTTRPQVIRIMVVSVSGSGESEFIQELVSDLSRSRWAVVGTEEPRPAHKAEYGRVLVSPNAVLHLIAVRGEKRFRTLWEHCLPAAFSVILLVDPRNKAALGHARAFLRGRDLVAPQLPVHVLVPEHSPSLARDLAGLRASDVTSGSIHDQAVRLQVLDRVLR